LLAVGAASTAVGGAADTASHLDLYGTKETPTQIEWAFLLCFPHIQERWEDLAVDWRCMEYPHILNLIDDYLDRLTGARGVLLAADSTAVSAQQYKTQPATAGKASGRRARGKQTTLLLESAPPQEPAAKSKTKKPTSKRSPKSQDFAPTLPFAQDELFLQETTTAEPHEERVEVEEQGLPEVVVSAPSAIRVRAPRQPSARRNATTAVTARALGGLVSAAPVFIRAEQIRQERAEKVPKSGTKADGSGSAPPPPLTAEMLTQRWLQGLNS
jgi:hypothetical protein